jgi:hypothetical protein
MGRSTSRPRDRDRFTVCLPVDRVTPLPPKLHANARGRKSRCRKTAGRRKLLRQQEIEPKGLHVAREIFAEFVGSIPEVSERQSHAPAERSFVIVKAAAIKAAALSGGLALPPGPLGILTIIPDLLGIWKIHNQMVADVAGAYGRQARLSQDQMVRCLCKHAACQLARDVIIRVIERALARRASLCLLQRVGVPILGAVAVAAFTYFDTLQVGKRAIGLFGQEWKNEKKAKKRRRRKPSVIRVNGPSPGAGRLTPAFSGNGNGAHKTTASGPLLNGEAQVRFSRS